MNRIVKAVAILAILLSAVMVMPMTDAESEQNTIRISNNYAYYAEFTYEEGMLLNKKDYMYLKEDNPKARVMLDYIGGEDVDILPGDDRRADFEEGERFYVFAADDGLNIELKVAVAGEESVSELIQGFRMPYGGGLMVKAGDRFTFKAVAAVDNYGHSDIICYLVEDGKYVFLGPGLDDIPPEFQNNPNIVYNDEYVGTATKTSEFKFQTLSLSGPASFYVDVTYEGSGFSTPSGSSAVFAALCAIITVGVLILLFIAGRGPNWSK